MGKRLEEMEQYIHERGKVSVSELGKKWDITTETVRRDLDKLEEKGILTRIHGGAVWNESIVRDGVHFYERQRRNLAEKRKLAKRAVPLALSNQVIFADASSTVLELLRLIQGADHLIVVTNSAEVFLNPSNVKMHIVSTGGIFNNHSMSFQGEVTKSTLHRYNANLAIIGCKGLNRQQGVMDSYESEAEIKKVMLEHADQVALLVDHTKFDQIAFLELTDYEKIDYLITDCKPSDEWMEFFESKQVEVFF